MPSSREEWARQGAALDQINAALREHPELDDLDKELGLALEKAARIYSECGALPDEVVGYVARAATQRAYAQWYKDHAK